MGAKDVKSNEYLADNSRFADLFNYKIYDGKQVILPEDLQERDSAEFLSGFKKGDKIIPVIPLILYWGSNAWDAPTNLHEMFEDINEELLPFIPNYHINLVEPSSIEDFDKFQTELGQNLTNETVSTINLFTSADITINTEGKVTNVCLAIQEIKQEYADEQVAKELINSVENLMKNFSISLEKACSGLEHTVEDYYNAKKLLENTSMN